MRGFRELDQILRGAALPAPGGDPSGRAVPIGPLFVVNVILAAFYGACMGVFGLFGREEADVRFLLADAIKVPLLFLLTLAVTFPSLYVFGALSGSRLSVLALARSLAAALGVLVAVLAAFGPIVAFFSVTTTSYPFILLLNVAVFTLAAAFAITCLLRIVDRLAVPAATPPGAEPLAPEGMAALDPVEATLVEGAVEAAPQGRDRPDRSSGRPRASPVQVRAVPGSKVRAVFWGWLAVFALVGVQMSWVLRPFVGMPHAEFAWLRPRQGSFFEAVATSLRQLLGG